MFSFESLLHKLGTEDALVRKTFQFQAAAKLLTKHNGISIITAAFFAHHQYNCNINHKWYSETCPPFHVNDAARVIPSELVLFNFHIASYNLRN